MSYSRFYNSNWYLWWNSDGYESRQKDLQLLAIAHVRMNDWPIYFTYRQLTQDLESCLFTLRKYIPRTESGRYVDFKRLKRLIGYFIEDVRREYNGE